jgi:hypothetical protein
VLDRGRREFITLLAGSAAAPFIVRPSASRAQTAAVPVIGFMSGRSPEDSTIYQFPESAEEGGFAGYGPRLEEIYRHIATPIARLLRGEPPRDIPVQQPTTFEFVINLNTAKTIGREIPETLLIRADKVIE